MKVGQRGFTLVELLVVIAIIALLFGILLPVLGNIDFVKKKTHCEKNLSDWHRALTAYCTMFKGRFPYPVDTYYGSKFSGPWVPGDRWAGMMQVRELKKVGLKAESCFCPFDPNYGNFDGWPANSWTSPFRITWGARDTVYVYVGYTMFIWRSTRFRDGRYAPNTDQADDDIPIVADTLFTRRSGTIKGGWYHGGGLPEGLFNADCNTLLKGGMVVYTDRHGFDWDEPALVIGSAVDLWWCAVSDD